MDKKLFSILLMLFAINVIHAQKVWTLKECIDYALEHNIQIQKSRISEEEGKVSLWQSRGALLPSASFVTNQSVGYRPFEQSTAIVQNGQVTTTTNKFTYQGSYGVNANVTLWNGGINQKNIEAQKLQNRITTLGTEKSELAIQEQIAQFYIQILYCEEALKVNKQLSATAKKQYERGLQMMEQGQISKADVAQLEAQWKSSEYDIVSAETQILNYKRQMKELLELDMNTTFDITGNEPSGEQVLIAIPSSQSVYEQALQNRPEIKSAELNIEAADMQLDIARRGYFPIIGVSASIGDSHYSASSKSGTEQMKTNLNASAGVNVSVPIFDQRKTKSSIEKAKFNKVSSQLDLQDQRNQLSSAIEQYWLNANSNQQKYISAVAKTQSQETSYELLNEQFNNGLKNIAELLQGKDNLVKAKQDELQCKYTALLNMQMLKFYSGEEIEL